MLKKKRVKIRTIEKTDSLDDLFFQTLISPATRHLFAGALRFKTGGKTFCRLNLSYKLSPVGRWIDNSH
jgi:hypothetical protein